MGLGLIVFWIETVHGRQEGRKKGEDMQQRCLGWIQTQPALAKLHALTKGNFDPINKRKKTATLQPLCGENEETRPKDGSPESLLYSP